MTETPSTLRRRDTTCTGHNKRPIARIGSEFSSADETRVIVSTSYNSAIVEPSPGPQGRSHAARRKFPRVMNRRRSVRSYLSLRKWRIKKPFITRTRARAGAAKKAAGCGEGARGASLSYLEPFPVNLGPPFVVVALVHTLAARMHSRVRECVWWWCLGSVAASGVRVHALARALRLCATSHRAAVNSIIVFLSPMHVDDDGVADATMTPSE